MAAVTITYHQFRDAQHTYRCRSTEQGGIKVRVYDIAQNLVRIVRFEPVALEGRTVEAVFATLGQEQGLFDQLMHGSRPALSVRSQIQQELERLHGRARTHGWSNEPALKQALEQIKLGRMQEAIVALTQEGVVSDVDREQEAVRVKLLCLNSQVDEAIDCIATCGEQQAELCRYVLRDYPTKWAVYHKLSDLLANKEEQAHLMWSGALTATRIGDLEEAERFIAVAEIDRPPSFLDTLVKMRFFRMREQKLKADRLLEELAVAFERDKDLQGAIACYKVLYKELGFVRAAERITEIYALLGNELKCVKWHQRVEQSESYAEQPTAAAEPEMAAAARDEEVISQEELEERLATYQEKPSYSSAFNLARGFERSESAERAFAYYQQALEYELAKPAACGQRLQACVSAMKQMAGMTFVERVVMIALDNALGKDYSEPPRKPTEEQIIDRRVYQLASGYDRATMLGAKWLSLGDTQEAIYYYCLAFDRAMKQHRSAKPDQKTRYLERLRTSIRVLQPHFADLPIKYQVEVLVLGHTFDESIAQEKKAKAPALKALRHLGGDLDSATSSQAVILAFKAYHFEKKLRLVRQHVQSFGEQQAQWQEKEATLQAEVGRLKDEVAQLKRHMEAKLPKDLRSMKSVIEVAGHGVKQEEI